MTVPGTSPAPGVVLGVRVGPFDGTIDADLARRCAEATHDRSPRVEAGEAVPPVAVLARLWEAQGAGRAALVPDEMQRTATGGVHGEHDLLLHREIVPGEPLRIWVDGHGSRPAGRNSLVTLRYVAVDADDAVVAEQWWTTVYLGTTCDVIGSPAPEHAFPDDARGRPMGSCEIDVDEDMTRRYAEVSGDWSPHHFDVDAARRSGSDRVFLHGLCTMALCAQGVVSLVGAEGTDRVRRVAVRFASPTWLGERLRVRVHDAGPLGYAFEADCAGVTVVTHGRVELR
jgi:acyl dehydratase